MVGVSHQTLCSFTKMKQHQDVFVGTVKMAFRLGQQLKIVTMRSCVDDFARGNKAVSIDMTEPFLLDSTVRRSVLLS